MSWSVDEVALLTIGASYTVIWTSLFYSLRTRCDRIPRWDRFATGAIFIPCGINYILDLLGGYSVENHVFTAVVAVITASRNNPFRLYRLIRESNSADEESRENERLAEIAVRSLQSVPCNIVICHFEGPEDDWSRLIVDYHTDFTLQFFPGLKTLVGCNWYDILPCKKSWVEAHRASSMGQHRDSGTYDDWEPPSGGHQYIVWATSPHDVIERGLCIFWRPCDQEVERARNEGLQSVGEIAKRYLKSDE